jgi:hypothetical protein
MAKSRKPQGFTDPLDSIFGVIFGNAKSKPVRIKPRKINGKNTNEMLVAGLAEIAARPANYVSNAVLNDTFGQYGGTSLVEFNLDKFDDSIIARGGDSSAGRMRIRTGDVAKFMSDPNGYINSVFDAAKEQRKWGTYLNIGRGMDSALMTTWAKKNGFSNKESLTIGMASSNFIGPDQVNEARRKFSENVVLSAVLGRSSITDKNDPKYIDKSVAKDVVRALDAAKGFDLKRDPSKLDSLLGAIPGLKSRSDYNDILKNIKEEYLKQLNGSEYGSLVSGAFISDGKINRDGYITTLQRNMQSRASLLDIKDPAERAQYLRLSEANNALDVLLGLKGPGFMAEDQNARAKFAKLYSQIKTDLSKEKDVNKRAFLQNNLNNLENGIQKLDRKSGLISKLVPWGSTITGDFGRYKDAMLSELDYELQKLKWQTDSEKDPDKLFVHNMNMELLTKKRKALKTMSGTEWRILLNDMNGTYQTMKANFGPGGLGVALLSGQFFNPDNAISPSMKMGIQLRKGTFSKGSFATTGKRNLADILELNGKPVGAEIWAPKMGIADGYAALGNLYFFTPSSLVKTVFFNAEGFIYLKHLQRMNLAKRLNSAGFADKIMSNSSKFDPKTLELLEKFLGKGANGVGHKIDELAFSTQYITLMESLSANSSNLGSLWNDIEKLYKKDQQGLLGALIRVSGAPARMMGKVQALYNNTVKEWINRKFVVSVVNRFMGEAAAQKVLSLGLTKLGLRQIISVAVSEWLAGIGAAVGGPIGAVAGFVLTQLAEGFIDKLIRPFIKLFFAALWFITIILLSVVAVFFMFIFNVTNPKPQSHLPPKDALECADGNPFADLYDFESQQDPGNLPDPDPNSSCPIHSKSMVCTQGDEAGSSAYHTARNSMDIGLRGLDSPIWYAPADGRVASFKAANNCLDGKNYGGAMIFIDKAGIEYHILHVQALASGAVSKGKPVAIIQTNLDTSWCWTGAHFHLDVRAKGVFVDDTQHWYQEKLKCNIMTYDPTCR